MPTRRTWLLCDYGNVLCLPPQPPDVAALISLTGVAPAAWDLAYWRCRLDYDRGDLTAAEFWATVVGAPVSPSRLADLIDADVRGWLHPAPATLDAVSRAAARGLSLALLSNAPHEVADAIDQLGWVGAFGPRLFSARFGVTKPDPSIYRLTLDALGAVPEDVWFVDDREANVAGAAALGMHGVLYRGDPAVIDAIGPGG